MIRMGIDPGTNEMGYAVFNDNQIIKFGLWKLNKEQLIKNFINDIENKIIDVSNNLSTAQIIMGPEKIRIQRIVIEKMFMSRNNKHLALLNIIPRIIEDLTKSLNIEYCEIHNATIKKLVAGNGRAQKDEVVKSVCKTYNLNFDYMIAMYGKKLVYNVTDAISIALADILSG